MRLGEDQRRRHTYEGLESTGEQIQPDDLLGVLMRCKNVKGEVKHSHASTP